ncbi:MFS transporter [Polaromonas jejuensis]|uniref:MFS transporter n=1 Tax=Polaromonas jejuensis TaxID=457502 RepID=A0ABW0Q4L3_9BURK|nr:MFS transporter [Polaromonas jejuensis]
MPFIAFLRDNARWLGGGFLLFFFSSVGQTFLISLSAGDIRREFSLSHGEFGSLYMAATLASALTLPRLGHLVDRYSARKMTLAIVPLLAVAAACMALSRHIAMLFVAIYLLRLLGQGMMTHTAFTVMARWFSAQRGRAVSLATLGLNTGEALLPLGFVALAASVGWRNSWWLAAGALLLLGLPLIASLVAVEREAQASDPVARVGLARDWTRPQVLRDPLFYLLMLAMAPPAFIGNTIFFHQVYLVELRGWSLQAFASAFTLYALMTIAFTLVSGQLIDRLSGLRLLPFYLLPLGLGLLLLGSLQASWVIFAFMAMYGMSNGFSLSLYGSLWPEIYGVKHLGAVRAVIVAVLVFASATGPGLAGLLIDAGVSYPALIVGLGGYCGLISLLMLRVTRRLKARAQQA